MSTTYFNSSGGLVAFGSQDNQADFIIKNALILPEGVHKCNKGKVYNIPASLVQEYLDNTNAALNSGVELPLKFDHYPGLLNPSGKINKFGKFNRVWGAIIQPHNLPDPKMTDLIGKFAMFGEVLINNYLDDVRKGNIKLLSPGIDLEEKRIAEVSAVDSPAIKGPAFFRSSGSPHAYFSLSYAEVKERKGLMGEKRSKVKDNLDTLFQVISDIESTDPNELIGVDPKALKLNALQDFYSDLLELFELDEQGEAPEAMPDPNNINPYQEVPEQYQQYSEEENDDIAEFSEPVIVKRRRRR